MKTICVAVFLIVFVGGPLERAGRAQSRGGHILYGDVKVDESKVGGIKAISFDIILYNLSGTVVARQTVSSNGRYRFIDLRDGHYDLVVEVENAEIARMRVEIMSPMFKTDLRRDLTLEWKPMTNAAGKPASVSVTDHYKRSPANQKRFDKAKEATDHQKYDAAVVLLREIVEDDPKDFQAWTEMGTVHLFKKTYDEAEKAYVRAVAERPTFFLALMNLGRLRLTQKNFDGAIDALAQAVQVKADSAEANFYLGEAYLQAKKGSKAVGHLYEALRLDPAGKADAHLRLAALYHAVGLKDKAAAEYEEFLKKKPDHSDRKKFQQYISDNKKP